MYEEKRSDLKPLVVINRNYFKWDMCSLFFSCIQISLELVVTCWVWKDESVRAGKKTEEMLSRWQGEVLHLSERFISDLKHWCGPPANNEAISTTGLWVGARQALYYQQRALLTPFTDSWSVLVLLSGPNPAFFFLIHYDLMESVGND